ncbi:MAG: hypothetical protein M1305_05730, partial [Candidatus Marsarchaeota archaeon]|nr:hypothetical protein [Candidatus Marsarchaeota archaeon]
LTGSTTWDALARKDVEIRQKLGLSTRSQARRFLAEIDMACAFERYRCNDFPHVPRYVVVGLRENPTYARNRGVWAILLRSLIQTRIWPLFGKSGTCR